MASDRTATSEGHPPSLPIGREAPRGENREVAQAAGVPPSRFSSEPSEVVQFFLGLEIVGEVIGFWALSWVVAFAFWGWAAGYFGGG